DAERKNKKEAESRAKLDEIFAKQRQREQEIEELQDAERKNKKEAEKRAKLDEIFAKQKKIEQELEEREILRRMALA
nr:hypothetical protein [Tanacetum cinerariifolium]